MADVMAAPSVGGRLAVIERIGRRWKLRVDAEVMQEAVRVKSEEIVESLFAHPEEIGIEDRYIFETEWDGGEGGKLGAGAGRIQWRKRWARSMSDAWRKRSGSGFCCR
jgi:hypothetical protein